MSKLHLGDKPTLRDFQEYVKDLVVERGFEGETVPQVFQLFFGGEW